MISSLFVAGYLFCEGSNTGTVAGDRSHFDDLNTRITDYAWVVNLKKG
jgi:hypothetical protein